MTALTISSQEDFEQFLKGYSSSSELTFDLQNWPILKIKYQGAGLHPSQVPARIASTIHYLRQDVRKLYCLAKYGVENKKLTEEEKKILDFTFEFKEGSLDEEIDLGKVVGRLVKGAVNKMEARHYVIVFGMAATVWCWDSWVERLEKRDRDESLTEIAKTVSDAQVKTLDKVTEILAADKGISKDKASQIVKNVVDVTQESQDRAIKVIEESEKATIGNQTLSKKDVVESVKRKRRTFEDVHFNINVEVYDVNFKENYVLFYDVDDNNSEKRARLELEDPHKIDVIRRANGKGESIQVTVAGRESEDGSVKDLVITDVSINLAQK